MSKRGRSKFLDNYWVRYYSNGHCTLCGNSGYINTRGVKTAAGWEVGRMNYCICPNGQTIRYQRRDLPNEGLPDKENDDLIHKRIFGY